MKIETVGQKPVVTAVCHDYVRGPSEISGCICESVGLQESQSDHQDSSTHIHSLAALNCGTGGNLLLAKLHR